MIFLIVGFPLTIIFGVLLGMFFLYPLGNVIPEDQYIVVYKGEFMVLAGLLVLGMFILMGGMLILILEVAAVYNLRILRESNKSRERSKTIHMVLKEEIGMSEQEIEKLMKKNILSEK